MATIDSNMSVSNAPVVTPNRAGEVIAQRGYVSLLAAQIVVANIIKLCKLPAGCVPVDLVIDFDELDANGSPTTTATFGILNDAGDALDVSAGSLSTTQLGAGGIQAATTAAFMRVAATTADRYIAVILGGTVATGAAGILGGTLSYRAKD
jgi:hypothetical protein